jgi:hypothetical protein
VPASDRACSASLSLEFTYPYFLSEAQGYKRLQRIRTEHILLLLSFTAKPRRGSPVPLSETAGGVLILTGRTTSGNVHDWGFMI